MDEKTGAKDRPCFRVGNRCGDRLDGTTASRPEVKPPPNAEQKEQDRAQG